MCDRKPEPANMAALGIMGANRERAQTLLTNEADRLRRKAHALEALAMSVGNLPPEADEALWELVLANRR